METTCGRQHLSSHRLFRRSPIRCHRWIHSIQHRIYPHIQLFGPPPSTMAHLNSVRRPCPLGQLREVLLGSQSFTLKMGRLLTPGRAKDGRTRMCRTYTCQLVTIDGRDLGDDGPVLCLKLYDDRFYPLHTPAEAMEYGNMQNMMFGTAEAYICREIAVYEKLDFAQGSIIPYFYGVHLFTMRDGLQVYGTLMEYVEGYRLDSGVCWSFSERQKIQLVQSARHAVRVLQDGDISQPWHDGHILAHRAPTPSDLDRVHCVLVGFSAATQSLYLTENHRQDDFGSCTAALIEEGTGLFEDFVMEHMGPREVWDFFSRMTGVWRFAPERNLPDPFAFIHTSQAGLPD
ncbi:hypothetical protein A0H81_03272 [Grifola frondosa]|uniref:Protein kinase domain-containing protein n=1 Tax=Grifola frondosa TaxID=5627 RepID=A0A1C7MHG9_GRIFR|nr:hypothetical protein A0H81_03272 [Grifola frondosa]